MAFCLPGLPSSARSELSVLASPSSSHHFAFVDRLDWPVDVHHVSDPCLLCCWFGLGFSVVRSGWGVPSMLEARLIRLSMQPLVPFPVLRTLGFTSASPAVLGHACVSRVNSRSLFF
ncbi:hypothetical protein R1flu_022520 [Riccia fluitans]|uniref:Secreted protein n=1 Tax=Riccia fluitans TaxID=41844 RepID=A0ABD1XTI1_9MARC